MYVLDPIYKVNKFMTLKYNDYSLEPYSLVEVVS
jgi:hypothetical protein